MLDIPAEKPIDQKLSSQRYRSYVRRAQRFGYWFMRALSAIVVRKKTVAVTSSDIKPNQRYILAANHQGHIDPFFLGAALPGSVYRQLGLLRFFAHSFFFNNPLYRVFLLSFGCFPARIHPTLPYGLPYATELLAKGDTLVIFPEGKMTSQGQVQAKSGVSVLAQEPDVMILPVHLEYTRYMRYFFTLAIAVGKPFSGKGMSAQEILDRIYALPI